MADAVERWQAHDQVAMPIGPQSVVDSWVTVIADVARLADYIAPTEFVPDAMRGRPAAVAAAILTGREMGLGPMAALKHQHVIKGKVGQSAELMRGQVQAAGHDLEYVETTDTRCVVQGRRKGSTEWTRVQFTADQAKRARIDLGSYPEDKLVARATSRLCRRMFSDCLIGMPYTVDELEDLPDTSNAAITPAAPSVTESATTEPPKRTAKRRSMVKKAVDPPAPREEEPAPVDGPPLPDEVDGDLVLDVPASAKAVTQPQLTRLHAFFTDHEITDRAQKLEIARALTGRPDLRSSTELTSIEAAALIDALAQLDSQAGDDFMAALDLLVSGLGAQVVADEPSSTEE